MLVYLNSKSFLNFEYSNVDSNGFFQWKFPFPVTYPWFWEAPAFASLCGTDLFHPSKRQTDRSVTKAAGSANFCFQSVENPWMSRFMNVLSTSLCIFALKFHLPFPTCIPSTTGGHELTPAIKGTFEDVWGVWMHLENDGLVEGILRRAGSSNMFQLILLHDLICLLTLEGKCWTNQFATK